MPYINLDPDYFDHRKTKRLVGLLGRGAELYPLKLWAYCARYHPATSILDGYSKEEIESLVGWDGEPGKCVDSLVKVSYLELVGNSYVCHDWKEHEGHIVAYKKRSSKANKARWGKIRKESKKDAPSNPKTEIRESPYHTIPTIPTKPTKPVPVPKKSSALEGQEKQKLKGKLASLVEQHGIRRGDPGPLVQKVVTLTGMNPERIWAAMVQSRGKDNPAGYLVSILADPQYAVADSALTTAKQEMRAAGWL